jgi:hypothetical protein
VAAALDQARAEAERIHGPLVKNPFLVTDNGSSFLARYFQRHIAEDYAHVRIGYRTPTQLGLLERFHQTLKAEEVYWKLYENPGEARTSLPEFRKRYNEVRPHWALVPEGGGDVLTPADVTCTAKRFNYRSGRRGPSPQKKSSPRSRRMRACQVGAIAPPRSRLPDAAMTHTKSGRPCPLDFAAKTAPHISISQARRFAEAVCLDLNPGTDLYWCLSRALIY